MTRKRRELPEGCDFPYNIGNPATQALFTAGYTRLEQLTLVSEKDLLALHGMGRVGVARLRDALAEKGLTLAEK